MEWLTEGVRWTTGVSHRRWYHQARYHHQRSRPQPLAWWVSRLR